MGFWKCRERERERAYIYAKSKLELNWVHFLGGVLWWPTTWCPSVEFGPLSCPHFSKIQSPSTHFHSFPLKITYMQLTLPTPLFSTIILFAQKLWHLSLLISHYVPLSYFTNYHSPCIKIKTIFLTVGCPFGWWWWWWWWCLKLSRVESSFFCLMGWVTLW